MFPPRDVCKKTAVKAGKFAKNAVVTGDPQKAKQHATAAAHFGRKALKDDRPTLNADDACEACKREVSIVECAHGILCEDCYEQLHGSIDTECTAV